MTMFYDITSFSTIAIIFMVGCALFILSVASYYKYFSVPPVEVPVEVPRSTRRRRRRRNADLVLLEDNVSMFPLRTEYTMVQTRTGSQGHGLTNDENQLAILRQQMTLAKLNEIRQDKYGACSWVFEFITSIYKQIFTSSNTIGLIALNGTLATLRQDYDLIFKGHQ
ncbi:hypothetical protein BDC45DRAFT_571886 [Circinella umbellata]|nr:hypothetical protein BDC45DRAFT_571886 [Circinella umbellata]